MIIKNKILPFKGFAAMAVYPFIFVRKDYIEDIQRRFPKEYADKVYERVINHEQIHFKQQKELLIVFFYIIYFILWIRYGYKNIPFEKEAYANEKNLKYLETRKRNAWLKYF